MKRLRLYSLITTVIVFAAGSSLAGYGNKEKEAKKESHAKIGEAAPSFTLKDTQGDEHSLADFEGKYVVLEWTNFDCPFVRKHYDSGNMQALQKNYVKKGIVWLRICSSAPGKQGHYKSAEIEKKIKAEKSMQTAYLIDEAGKVGRMYGAKTTPHMYVINPEGVLIYAGGIDDKPSTNKADIDGATNYITECLEAAMDGKPVKHATTKPYGCSVKYRKDA